MLDVSKAMPVQVGDEVVFYGKQGEENIAVEEIADMLGTINYEVTCMLDRRIPRVYKENDETTAVVNILRKTESFRFSFYFWQVKMLYLYRGIECS